MIRLSGIQKSALLLISMDIKTSAKVLKGFTDSEISSFIDAILTLDASVLRYTDIVICEFYKLLKKKKIVNFNIKNHILKIIENTVGLDVSRKLFKKSLIKNDFVHNVAILETLGAKNIFLLIKNENLNIITALLIYMNKTLTTDVLSYFSTQNRLNILKCMVSFTGLKSSGFLELNKIIRVFLYTQKSSVVEKERINKIVYIISYFVQDNIIQFINKINTPYKNILNKSISKYFNFKDIVNIEDSSVKFIINNTDIDDLCIFLCHTDESVQRKFISNFSHKKYQYFKKTVLSSQSIDYNTIYFKKKLLLKNIKRFIRDDKIIIKLEQE
ncbi:Flagellar motor switch protein FliG [Buchnera aphidicola (Cinara pseudotaxifoliae)]|uniref:Flagellar motor switch protein FliG n=1 Tax=Buchnera aphidicola (Cinara pseudotaxifoliae) TaxID=655384 RepID=A0A451DG64_9GAMM|nr:FliG C-terminal domain-containing protein [Buchnera aphidicola]VFP85618.1 Flagellar motor switch protein FliG [Buchnera aphidicola (Cinara pseudotaxifoliae)]